MSAAKLPRRLPRLPACAPERRLPVEAPIMPAARWAAALSGQGWCCFRWAPAAWCWRTPASPALIAARSEEHTSELQSRFDIVCRLLLEKKKSLKLYDCFRVEEQTHHTYRPLWTN